MTSSPAWSQGRRRSADFPEASNSAGEPRVLYGVHDGGIPGTGNPTNRGVDPYVATRSENGWTTKYVGIPADGPRQPRRSARPSPKPTRALTPLPSAAPKSARPASKTASTGNPIHLPNGELVQGMAGSIPQPKPNRRASSASTSPPTASTSSSARPRSLSPTATKGEISIYDRNLKKRAKPTSSPRHPPGRR